MTSSILENKVFDEIKIGDSAQLVRRLTRRDVELFAVASGDLNPSHLDETFASDPRFQGVVAHNLLSGALISAVLGTQLPGPGTVYLEQDLKFLHLIRPDDTLTVRVTVRTKDASTKRVVLDCIGTNQDGREVIAGTAHVIAPTKKFKAAVEMPSLRPTEHDNLRLLIEQTKHLPPLCTAVVHPCDQNSLQGALDAASEGLIVPILVGPEAKIRATAEACGASLAGIDILSVPHSHAAADKAVELARTGKVGAIMKGSLHSDEILGAIISREGGLRTDRRMSHVFAMDVPTYKWPLLITDAALNILPGLLDKRDICQNAIDLAHDLGMELPRVAILAAAETVSATMPATLDAAALCKMAERGQITGGLLDGPLAFDNAINAEAARVKGIISPVAGQADVLVVPNIESGNMLVKQLDYLAAAESAGIVLGARVPVMLTSRADKAHARLASAALAVLSAAGAARRLASQIAAGKA